MRNWAVAVGILLLASLAAAQTSVTPSWFATNRNDWSATAPLINAPVIQLAAPPDQVGATSGTAGNTVGASASAPLNLGVTGSAVMMPGIWTTSAYSLAEAPPSGSSQGLTTEAGSRGLNLGAAAFDSAYDFPDLGQASLAQFASRAKKNEQHHSAKVYTNDDVQRLKEQQETAGKPSAPQPPSTPAPPSAPPQ